MSDASSQVKIEMSCQKRISPSLLSRLRSLAACVAVREMKKRPAISRAFKKPVISVRLITNASIKEMNREFLDSDRATDVISFSYIEDLSRKGRADKAVIGDVAVSFEMAKKRCREYGNTFGLELALYVAHGILHVFGHDDSTPRKRASMDGMQARYVEKFFG
jgi:probable rRNA maturation factor